MSTLHTPRYLFGKSVLNNRLYWSSFRTFAELHDAHFLIPRVLKSTEAGYQALTTKAEKLEAKDGLYLIPCTIDSEEPSRAPEHRPGPCNLVIIDIDDSKDARSLISRPNNVLRALNGWNFAAYTTASSTPENPRLRVVVDADSIPADQYGQAVHFIASNLGLQEVTGESLKPKQPMILPSRFSDQDFDWNPEICSRLDGRAFGLADMEECHAFESHSPARQATKNEDTDTDGLEFLKMPEANVTVELVKDALSHINPDLDYPEWFDMAQAMKHQHSGSEEEAEAAYEAFDAWSGKGSKYLGPDDTRREWDKAKPTPKGRRPITIRSLFRKAKQAGWNDPRKPTPHPLPSSLLSVPVFDCERLLPLTLRGYVQDCAERLQVDPAFVAVPLLVSLGSVLGNRLGLRPKTYDDYTEFANLWGAIMGRPATLKSPSLSAASRFIEKLEKSANQAHQDTKTDWQQQKAVAKIQRQAAAQKAKKVAMAGQEIDPASLISEDDDDAGPPLRRFTCNDASPESLHSILSRPENATGVLLFNDELSSLIARMNDPERGAALRSFLLSGWNGNQSAVVDRIGRGENLRVDRCCVSVLGGIQPGKLAPLVDAAVKESAQDDGWLQRFSLLVYPDAPVDFQCIDRAPDATAYAEVMSVFERVEAAHGEEWVGAEYDDHRGIWFIRFEPAASDLFKEWIETETRALRSGDLGAAVESHFIKYRKAVCGLALLFHVVQEHDQPSVSMYCLQRALAWLDYLKCHALRVYGSRQSETAKVASRILARLRKRDLPERFTVHQLKRPCWSGLTDGETITAALNMLVDHGWLSELEVETGGRPRVDYLAHPQTFQN